MVVAPVGLLIDAFGLFLERSLFLDVIEDLISLRIFRATRSLFVWLLWQCPFPSHSGTPAFKHIHPLVG